MVDYTKPELRDESWWRWKGGSKLATELRNFYTAKHVFDRLGQSVPLAADKPSTAVWDKRRPLRLRQRHLVRRGEVRAVNAFANFLRRRKLEREGNG